MNPGWMDDELVMEELTRKTAFTMGLKLMRWQLSLVSDETKV